MSTRFCAVLSAAIASVSCISAAHAGKLVLSEVLYDEVGSTFDGEWFEIYNGGTTAIDLSGYKIGDEETKLGTTVSEGMFQFPAGATIAPNEVQIVSSFASRYRSVYGIAPTYEIGSSVTVGGWVDDELVPNMSIYSAWDPDGAYLNMNNTNDQAVLLDEADNVVDGVSWGSNFFFTPGVSLAQAGGQSIARTDPLTDTDTAADWSLTPAAPAGATWTSRSTPGTLPVAVIGTWTADGDGVWTIAANWKDGFVPSGAGVAAVFGNTNTAPRTVTLLDNQTLGAIKFDSAQSYILSAPGGLTLDVPSGLALVQVAAGSHTISAPVTLAKSTIFDVAAGASLAATGEISSAAVGITKAGGGALSVNRVRASSLTVTGGTLSVAMARSDAATSVVGALTVSTGASLDLGDNAIVIDYATTSPLAAIAAAISDGRIASSRAIAGGRFGIATADTAAVASLINFGGETLDTTAVVARVALKGDADISGTVNFSDLVSLAQNYNLQEGGTWTKGDSNYDGIVNFADLVSLAQNYNQNDAAAAGGLLASSFGSGIAADWALAQTLVPEPTVVLSALLGTSLLGRRRR